MTFDGYILVLDAGSGSGRAVVFDTDGNEVSVVQKEWLPKVLPQYPGSQVFDTQEVWQTLCCCVREALTASRIDSAQIIGVSATSMREGMVLYDANRTEIWACPNIDARATEEVVEMLREGIAEDLYRIGGDWLNIISPPRFRWINKHEPDVLKQTAFMSMISDWILFKLSGSIVTDPTMGCSSGLFDLKARAWSEKAIKVCRLPEKIYPPVVEPGTVMGKITDDTAAATGLKAGTPVVSGGADTQLALLGIGNIEPGQWALVGGTFWQTTVISDRPLIDPEFRPRTLCHVNAGRWMTEGITFLVGQQARWLRDGFCQEEVRRAREQGFDPYYLMEKEAAQVPAGANGVIGLFSYVHNSRLWKHAAPSFLNFDIYNPGRSGKRECIRALWESAAYASYGNYKVLGELAGTTPDRITFCGGAAKGFLWPQIIADVFGIPVSIPSAKEATSLGCAMCVGIGTGLFKSFGEAVDRWVKIEKEFFPSRSAHSEYSKHYDKWQRVYTEFMKIVNQDLLTPMWRAPGT
ncbi:MAG TPA: autoinducer-2 kinase [Acidobacteriaceae bacterium]|jgi:autoinducer 2 (AI-2) kinase|nr:autoinducer-2 kinase [Acidobacteriaceae bacterium]